MDGKELARDIKAKIKTEIDNIKKIHNINPMVATICLLYTSPSPRDCS